MLHSARAIFITLATLNFVHCKPKRLKQIISIENLLNVTDQTL